MSDDDLHPMVSWAERHGKTRKEAAEHFFYNSYAVFRMTVTGHTAPGFERCQEIAAQADGEFDEMELLLWHQRNRRK